MIDTAHLPGENFGGEFVSPVIDIDDDSWKETVRYIIHSLRDAGEGVSKKTSIHVHVNCSGLPRFALQHLVRLGLYLEDGMFRLACGEAGEHRGASHLDYGYCRPISGMGPPVTPTVGRRERHRQVFTTKCLLAAQTDNEFLMALGRRDRNMGNKYHEARYVWLNFLSLYSYGSIEFRLFNTTGKPEYLFAWVKLCQEIIQASFGKHTELPENPLGSGTMVLDDIIELLCITDGDTIHTLEELWELGDYQPGVVGLQMGHLADNMVDWRNTPKNIIPPIVNADDIFSFNEHRSSDFTLRQGFKLTEVKL